MTTSRLTATLDRHPTNPFATRHTRPGAIVPLDERGRARNLEKLLAVIARLGGSAAITGPHGTGKSTLLVALANVLADRGERVTSLRVRSPSDLGGVIGGLNRMPAGGILCLDGWERLGRLASLLVVLWARRRGVRLIVTNHRPGLLPTIVQTRGTLPLLAEIVERLPSDGGLLTSADLSAAFARHQGNLRESLADLYDRVEERRRA